MNGSIKTAKEALERNGYTVFTAETKDEAREKALALLPEGCSIALGGSVTLTELELLPALRSSKYRLIDRYAAESPEEMRRAFRDGLTADWFISGCNAITRDGLLYNVDGTGNRLAALTYGPGKVLLIAGRNKIVKDLPEAVLRVKTLAAPLNAKRLNRDTYCAKTGHCLSVDQGKGADMCAGCASPQRICLKYGVNGMLREPGHIAVLLVNEDLGY